MIFGNGLKKNKRKDPVKMAIMQTPPELVGAIYIYGRIKSGKTVSILSLAGLYHDNPNRKYKIIDLWGGSRNEHLYWGLPSNQTKYWNYVEKHLRLDSKGPKQYNVEYLYPITKKLRKKLPFNPPYVTSKIFSFDIRDLEAKDFALIMGTVPENMTSTWREIIENSKKNDSANDIVERFQKNSRKGNLLYNSVLKPLTKNNLLQSSNCEFNLNQKEISKMLDDQEKITVLCLDFVEEEYKLFIVGYFLRKNHFEGF